MMRVLTGLLLLLASITSVLAQSNPGLRQGDIPTAAQWNSYFAAKQDFVGTPITASTLVGQVPIAVTPTGGIFLVSCASFTNAAAGCVPASGGGTLHFLRADGTWADPPGGTGCTIFSSTEGGCVLASGGGTTNFLRADGAWAVPSCAPLFSDVAAGCVPASGGGTTNFMRADGTWAAPPSGAVTVGTTTVNSGGNKVLYDNNGTLGAGVEVIPTAFTRTALQAAVTAVCSAGGGIVRLLDGDYVFPGGSSAVSVTCSDISIIGTSKTRLVAPADSTTIAGLIQVFGSNANITTLASNAARGATALTLTSATGYAIGDYFFMSAAHSVYLFTIISKVTNVAGNVVTIADPLPFAVNVGTDSTSVVELVPRENVVINNIQFVGNGNTGTTRGVYTQYCARCQFTNLTFRDFLITSAFFADYGYANFINHIVAINAGSVTDSDIQIRAQTGSQIDNISSLQAAGFGPQFIACSYIQVGKVNSHHAFGRGVKLSAVKYSTFASLIGNNTGSTGIAISLGSSDNTFGELIAVKNVSSPAGNGVGVWFSGQENVRNLIGMVRASENGDADIALASSDDNNIIVSSITSVAVANGGTGNSIVTNKILP